jgi:hypothetical protein
VTTNNVQCRFCDCIYPDDAECCTVCREPNPAWEVRERAEIHDRRVRVGAAVRADRLDRSAAWLGCLTPEAPRAEEASPSSGGIHRQRTCALTWDKRQAGMERPMNKETEMGAVEREPSTAVAVTNDVAAVMQMIERAASNPDVTW